MPPRPTTLQSTPPRPVPPSVISDQAGVLTATELAYFNARIAGMRRDGLANVAVAIVPSIGGATVQRAAANILRAWRIGDEPRRLPFGWTDAVLLLVVLETPEGGDCGVAAGGGDGSRQFAEELAVMCRRNMLPPIRSKQYAQAITGGLILIESRLRTAAGIGLAPKSAPANPPRGPAPQPVSAPPTQPAPPRTSGNGLAWLAGSIAVMSVIFAVTVTIRRRAQNAVRKCAKCDRLMERASEIARVRFLDEAQERDERAGKWRHVVWACRCGHTHVDLLPGGGRARA